MLIPYLRSSSIGTFNQCELKHHLTYIMGFPDKSGAAACKGTIFHVCMELRALAGLAHKEGKKTVDHDVFGEVSVEWAKDHTKNLQAVLDYFIAKNQHIKDVEKKVKYKEIDKWCRHTLDTWPQYDPFKTDLLYAEYHFDIKIKEDWAKYNVTIGPNTFNDYMRIVGTIDCIIDLGDNIWEIYDFKTGKRADFITGEEKNTEKLKHDHQLLFYLYACKKVWPDKDFVMSLNFINEGGIYSVFGTDEILERAERMVKNTFTKMKKCYNPTVFDNYRSDWRCRYCCTHSKPTEFTEGKSLCEFMKNKIKEKGLKKTVAEHTDWDKFGIYGSGGGKDEETRKNEKKES